MSDDVVSEQDWARWEREREAANERHDARRRHEAARPVDPTREDLLAQLHALRHHNEALVSELDRLRALSLGYVLGQIERMGDEAEDAEDAEDHRLRAAA